MVDTHLYAASINKPIKQDLLLEAIWNVLTRRISQVINPAESRPLQVDAEMGRRLPLRILMAEDNPVNQRVAQMMLGKLGYQGRDGPKWGGSGSPGARTFDIGTGV